jgi:hypothetical protein
MMGTADLRRVVNWVELVSMTSRGGLCELEQIVDGADHGPLGPDLVEAAQEELAEASGMFDMAEHRFISTTDGESDSCNGMSKTFRPWDIEQRWLLPPSVHELVPAGHVAHFVRDVACGVSNFIQTRPRNWLYLSLAGQFLSALSGPLGKPLPVGAILRGGAPCGVRACGDVSILLDQPWSSAPNYAIIPIGEPW